MFYIFGTAIQLFKNEKKKYSTRHNYFKVEFWTYLAEISLLVFSKEKIQSKLRQFNFNENKKFVK